MFIPFFLLSILSVLLFVFNTSSGDFFSGAYQLKLMLSPFLIFPLFSTFVLTGVPSLLLTGIFSFLIRKKKRNIGRRRYYIYLFIISLIAPVVILLILTGIFNVVSDIIYSLQIGLLVVFIHWLIECIVLKYKNKMTKHD